MPDVQHYTPSRILYVSFASPVPAKLGPARRHYHILDQLSRFYDVFLLSLGDPGEEEMFSRDFRGRVPHFEFVSKRGGPSRKYIVKVWRTMTGRCDFVPVLELNLRRRCSSLASAESFDAIFLSSVLLRGLPLPPGIPIIGDTQVAHNVEFDILRRTSFMADSYFQRQYACWQWRSTRREERRCAKRVDLLLATSERDRGVFATQLRLRGVSVIPNGIDLAEFAPKQSSARPETILFSGLMSYYPNQQAIQWFLDSIFPLILLKVPGAKLVVAGASPPRWLTARRAYNIEVTGLVSDMRPFLERASVVIAPLLIGGGTRVKILEAQAMAKPVVSTSLGAEGLNLSHGESILIGDDAESFADRVIDILRDPQLASSIATKGRSHTVRHFDWNRIGERLSCLLQTKIGLVARTELEASLERPVLMEQEGYP